jgi:ubiquinone/menaquinone biosynthesis C-methylase UbiE
MGEPNSSNPARFYESYLVRYFFGPWAQDLLERARPQAGECVLDLACGTGALTREVLKHIGPHGSVIGVDISPDMLRVASEVVGSRGGMVEWGQGSAEALPLADASVDLAVCQQGLQFFPDKLAVLRQLKRVLKPSGRVALSVWRGIEHWPVQYALSRAAHGRLGRAITPAFGFGEHGLLERLLTEAGFQHVRVDVVEKTVVFPSADEFVDVTVNGAAAVLPELKAMSQPERAELAATVWAEVEATIRSYTRDGQLQVPTAAHLATAHA